jgi:hypothetical protein
MSPLLTDLRVLVATEELGTVLDLDVGAGANGEISADLEDVLLRVMCLPDLDILIGDPGRAFTDGLGEHALDLFAPNPDGRRRALREVLSWQQHDRRRRALLLRQGTIALGAGRCTDAIPVPGPSESVLFVTDRPDTSRRVADLGSGTLLVAVGFADPAAAIEVADLVEVASLLDVVATLRSRACRRRWSRRVQR